MKWTKKNITHTQNTDWVANIKIDIRSHTNTADIHHANAFPPQQMAQQPQNDTVGLNITLLCAKEHRGRRLVAEAFPT